MNKIQMLHNSEGATPTHHMHGILVLLREKRRGELKQRSPDELGKKSTSLLFIFY